MEKEQEEKQEDDQEEEDDEEYEDREEDEEEEEEEEGGGEKREGLVRIMQCLFDKLGSKIICFVQTFETVKNYFLITIFGEWERLNG